MPIGRGKSERDSDVQMEMYRRELLDQLNNGTGAELRTAIQEGEQWVYVRSDREDVTDITDALDHAKRRLGQ